VFQQSIACGKITFSTSNYSCKNYQLANLYPARAVALGCVYVVMEERGLRTTEGRKGWVDRISSRKVDVEDFEEVVEAVRSI